MAFHWRADDGPILNAGLIALWCSGDPDQYCWETLYFCYFSVCVCVGGTSCPTLDPRMLRVKVQPCLLILPSSVRSIKNQNLPVPGGGSSACADPEGDRGSGPPWKITKNIGFLSNTGSDPLKNQAAIQCWTIIGLPAKRHLIAFRWWADNGPLLVIFWSSLPWSTKKTLSELNPLWQLSGSAHVVLLVH